MAARRMNPRKRRTTRRLPPQPPPFTAVEFVASKTLVPADTGRTIFIVGTPDFPKWALFGCPCENKHQLNVPLMKSVEPHWRLTLDTRGLASLSPSISVDNDPCTSHFWLRLNQVEWALWA